MKIVLTAFLSCIFVSSLCHAQGIPFAVNPPAPNARLTACSAPATGNPCTNTVSIYGDVALTQLISQPVFIGPTGAYTFFYSSSAGVIQIQISGRSDQIVGGGGGSSGGQLALPTGSIADYRMPATESGNTIVDFTYSGNNANLASNCTSGTSPTRVSGTGGLSFAGSNCFNLPSALNNARTILLSLSLQPSAQTHSYVAPILGNGNGAPSNANGLMVICGTNSGGGGLPNCAYKSVSGGAQANGANSTVGGTLVLAVTFGSATDSTNDHLFVNGVEAAYQGVSTSQSAGLQTVGNYVAGGTATGNGFSTVDSGTWFVGTEYRIVMYSRFLSASEVAAASAVLQQDLAARGVTTFGEFSTSATDSWMALGDSITAGAGTLTTPWPNQITLNGTWAPVFNAATGGNSAQSIALACSNGQLNSMYSPVANRDLVVIFAGTNDVNSGKTPAQAWNSLASCGAALKKAGYQTIVVTMLSRTSNDANKNSLDTLIRANAVPTYFNAIADAAEVVSIGADGASGGACFQDGIHPTQGCSTNNLVPVIQRTMDSLYACQNYSCATVYGSVAPAGTADTAESESGNTMTFTSTLNPGVGSTVSCTGATPAGYNSPAEGWYVLTSSASSFTAYNDTTGLGAGSVHATCSVPQEKDGDAWVILNHNGNHTLESAVGNYCRTFHAGNGNTPTLVPWGSQTINGAANLAMTSNETVTACPQLVSASAAGANWITLSK